MRLVISCLRAAAYLVFLFVIYHVLVGLNTEIDPDLPWFAAIYCLIILASIAWPANRWSAWPLFRVPGGSRRIWLPVAFGVLIVLATLVLSGAAFGLTGISLPAPENASPAVRLAALICYPLFSAVTEEIGFRGILQGGLDRGGSGVRAIWIAAGIFVLAHTGNDGFWRLIIFYATLGLLCGIVAKRTKSVLPAIALHLVVNGILLAITMTYGSVDLNNTSTSLLWVVGIVGFVSLYGFIMEFAHQPSG
jgi:membrane protease YdiL (CAAX protease family)